jgi:hypothetical protein
VVTPIEALNATAYAERLVRSLCEGCLDRPILSGERWPPGALDEPSRGDTGR